MSLKASALKQNEAQVKSIKRETNLILNRMDDELKAANESGRHQVMIPVPINFSIPYLKNKDAQRVIYYNILTSLIDRGFNPKLELKKDLTMFHITWLSDDEIQEITEQNTLLAKHTKKNHLRDINDKLV